MKSIILSIFIFLTILNGNEPKVVNAVLGIDKPPFIFDKDSKKGIEADLIKEIFETLGYKVNMIQRSKEYMQTILDKPNKYDLVATITPSNDKLFYSKSFTTYENFVITRKNEHFNIKSIDDLKSIRFVAWNGAYNDLGEKFYKLFNPIDGTAKSSYNDNISQKDDVEMFFERKVDAIIIDKQIFNWFKLHYHNNENYRFDNIFKTKKEYPVTFRTKRLRDIFDVELQKFKDNGRYEQIIKFYATQNMEELLTYTKLLNTLSSKYIFDKNISQLNLLLKRFINHKDVLSIIIKDTKANVILSVGNDNIQIKDYSTIQQNIYYSKNGKAKMIGTIRVSYRKDYKSKNGVLIKPLSYYKNNPNYSYIKQIYIKLNLIQKNKIVLTKKEKYYLKNHKIITVHNEQNWAPYNFNENGVPKGFVIDYMDLLAKKLNINIKYISNYSWDGFINLIKKEQIDVIANIVKTKQRETYINFTKPFIKSRKAIFSNTLNVQEISELNGKTVAVPNQYFIDKYLFKNYPKIKIKRYKDAQDCLYAIINKEADAMIENYDVVNYLIKKDALTIKYVNVKINPILITNIAMGIRKSQPILRDILQKAQDSISKKEFEKLKNKWFGLDTIIQPFSDLQQEYIKRKKIIRVCTNPNWNPIEFLQNGKPKGITIDILNNLSKQIGIKLKYINTNSWSEAQQFLKEKRCDILSSASKTDQRKSYANFTKPYLSYYLAIVTKKDKPVVTKLSSIIDKLMARKEGSGVSMLLKSKYPHIDIKITKNMKEALQYVQDGKCYFTLATLPVLSYNKKRFDLNDLKVSGYSDIKLNLRFAVRDDDKMLYTIMNKAVDLIPNNMVNILNDKWTTQEVINKVDYKLVWEIIIVFILIIVYIIINYRKQSLLTNKIKELNSSLNDRVKTEVEKNKHQQLMMLEQSRLAQMGEMISMIAHQWRQPLNILSMLNQSIILKYKKKKLDESTIDYFQSNSKKQIQYMSQTIDDFRDFFKPQKESREFYIHESVEKIIDMSVAIYNKLNIDIDFTYQDKFIINGYKNELGQVISNILNNAKDALSEKEQKNKYIKITLEKVDNNIIITICDNAGGIPNDILDKIFDPYFSTKENKNGTGLGLYMSKIIIQEHFNAQIKVSNDDKGAIFKIIF
jgi:ABC-type amino acid transport substrate-binding protein/nitrogen-specific signal transduction histidine kinase